MNTATRTALRLAIGLGTTLASAAIVGCDGEDSDSKVPAVTKYEGAGGAPTYGRPTGTGFPSGDAAHGSGSGSGLEGFHGTGAAGTSAAVSDTHKPATMPAKDAVPPVLPEL